VLLRVTAERRQLAPSAAHTIWETMLHVTAQEDAARRRLEGEPLDSLPPPQSWPPVGDTSPDAWRAARERFEEVHRRLRRAVAEVSDSRLSETVPGRDYPLYLMLYGVVQHALYHAGQIVLLHRPGSLRRMTMHHRRRLSMYARGRAGRPGAGARSTKLAVSRRDPQRQPFVTRGGDPLRRRRGLVRTLADSSDCVAAAGPYEAAWEPSSLRQLSPPGAAHRQRPVGVRRRPGHAAPAPAGIRASYTLRCCRRRVVGHPATDSPAARRLRPGRQPTSTSSHLVSALATHELASHASGCGERPWRWSINATRTGAHLQRMGAAPDRDGLAGAARTR
jgi:uncharacterized damage-inducible protein DinB